VPSETWVAVNIAFRLEVVDEGALVQAALADLESADMGDEERQMRIRFILDAESGAMEAACWLLGPDGLLSGVPGVVLGDCTITATYADSERGLDDPLGLDEPE
jgi:uncharacterized membrane protein